MRKGIFEIENRLDINKEFITLVETLNEAGSIYYERSFMSFFKFINKYVFNLWEYRDTFVDLGSYLKHIGIDEYILSGRKKIEKEKFLNFLEFLLNILDVIKKEIGIYNISFKSVKVENIIDHNVPIILEKMNYISIQENDKIRVIKRDSDVDSVIDIVPENISQLLLEYNDIRNNNIESKKSILKKIDLYIDDNEKEYKSIDANLLNSIGTIVNKMGINHVSKEEPFCKLTKAELMVWYDKCFKMMIHLIREKEIIEIKKERNALIEVCQ